MSGVVARFGKSADVKHIDRDLAKIHPVMRGAVCEVVLMCEAECLNFGMFEGFRSPQRQKHIYLQGRVQSRPGQIVTQHQAWHSYHQFGLAVDFALVVDGEFAFETPENYCQWIRLREIGEMYGLEGIEGEAGHLQYAGLELAQLRKGSYPGGGDPGWWENLRHALDSYPLSVPPKAPASRNA
jgi:peptidoglycan LD-endopeptidase CwlK